MGVPKEIQDATAIKWDDNLFLYYVKHHPEQLTIYVPIEAFIEFNEKLSLLGLEQVKVVASAELKEDQLFAAFPKNRLEDGSQEFSMLPKDGA